MGSGGRDKGSRASDTRVGPVGALPSLREGQGPLKIYKVLPVVL